MPNDSGKDYVVGNESILKAFCMKQVEKDGELIHEEYKFF